MWSRLALRYIRCTIGWVIVAFGFRWQPYARICCLVSRFDLCTCDCTRGESVGKTRERAVGVLLHRISPQQQEMAHMPGTSEAVQVQSCVCVDMKKVTIGLGDRQKQKQNSRCFGCGASLVSYSLIYQFRGSLDDLVLLGNRLSCGN